RVDNFIVSDGGLATWERASVELLLPTGTDYIGIDIYADENIHNDTSGIEFDGHYADAVTVSVTPEPATLSLLALGGLAILRRRFCRPICDKVLAASGRFTGVCNRTAR
ncbi:MAG: PEP-CTERM sorting domain-containing protein, partial [Phycisphaerae bacterium]|nr:PEP-CTERM sorting domain-containing protein [Phycisphaerae bacterium]